MEKWSAVVCIFLLVLLSIIPSTAEKIDNSLLPTNKGNILYIGGNGSGNYTKIQDVVNTTSNGDTVFMYHGSYSENVDIDKIINLIEEDKKYNQY